MKEITLTLPKQNCNTKSCVVEVNAKYNFQVNATISKLVYDGPNSKACKYAGISFLQQKHIEYDEIFNICELHGGKHSQSRSMYSRLSKLLIVLYWYTEYSHISAELKLKETSCTPVYFDYCLASSLCKSLSPACATYLQQTNFSTLQFQGGQEGNLGLFLRFSFPAKQETCHILLLIQNNHFF